MLSGNNETEIKQIIEKKGKEGWLRVQECAKEFAKDPITKRVDYSRRTKFYRIRKQIEKGKVEGLKVQVLPGNISYIGLSSAKLKAIEGFISGDKKTSLNIKTGSSFFTWLDKRAERKKLEEEERRLAACSEADMIVKEFPSLGPLKTMVSDVTRKEIKEARKQRKLKV